MIPRLHLILDPAIAAAIGRDPVAIAVAAAGHGAGAVHLRWPGAPAGRVLALARALRTALPAAVLLLINDRLDVALASGADGAQLPGSGMPVGAARALVSRIRRRNDPPFLIGCSVHAADAACAAEREGADFALLGTVFASESHPGERPGGASLVRATGAATGLPLIAIGGITTETAARALEAGADGVAAIRAIVAAPDPGEAAAALLRAMDVPVSRAGRTGGTWEEHSR